MTVSKLRWVALVVVLVVAPTRNVAAEDKFDVVLQNGRIVDGTGAPWYYGDVGIRDGKIVRIGRIRDAKAGRTIDAAGLTVAPGFIDMMGQTATPFIEDPAAAMNLLTQGITTINAGEGQSAAPLSDSATEKAGWQTLGEYFQVLELKGMPINVVQTVGHTQVRRIVLGEVDRRPNPRELKRMQQLVEQAMEDGAIGLSTALIYPPAVYATTEEIAALAKVAGKHGGRYYTHMRNEGDRLLEAIDEALEIGRQADAPVHIFHLKAAGRQNWGKMDQAIARIKAARAAGQQVGADIYPYINNGLGIAAFIHPRHFAEGRDRLRRALDDPKLRAQIRKEMESEGGWENWYRHTGNDWNKVVLGNITHKEYSRFAGQTLGAIAAETKEDPWDVFFKIAKTGAFALPQSMTDANKIKLMQQEFISFCTDVGPAGGSRIASHPRAAGSFPRLLSHYVRDLGAISLERVVAQASAVAANEVMAYDRGRIAVGLAADIIVFDYGQLADKATFAEPLRHSVGMKYVLVNGQLVLDDGKLSKNRPGRVLRGPGYRRSRSPSQVTTGTADARMKSFDDLTQSFLEEHAVPGAALAVTDHGRLVYARGYGYADIAARQPVTPNSLFRIASISKPITAVAILQLIEQNKLSLDSKVFEVLPFDRKKIKDFDERLMQITIRQLMQHTGGWDRGVSFDAMFQSVRFAKALGVPSPANSQQVIDNMMSQPLDFEPGKKYAYSNYGYNLLGRVIERISGQPYDEYVKQHVLKPLGITDMRIGRTHLKHRHVANEVKYYNPGKNDSVFQADLGQMVPNQYGAWHLEAMDSHGAWIASAVDLARFAAAFDDPKNCPVLKSDSITTMFAPPHAPVSRNENGDLKETYYACGWMIRNVEDGKINTWHTGSLPGTATILVRRHDGHNWAVLFNARSSPQAGHFGRAIDRLIHKAANAVTEWPQGDRFEKFFK